MALVFQAFVKNFLRIEQSKYEVRPLQLEWDAVGEETHVKLLPKMTTDIHLVGSDERIIIDTKYYKDALQQNYGKQSLDSENLYQLFAYLKNAEKRGPQYSAVKGVLLYPAVGEIPPFEATIQGHEIRVFTINLDQPWQNIKADLLTRFGCGSSTNDPKFFFSHLVSLAIFFFVLMAAVIQRHSIISLARD